MVLSTHLAWRLLVRNRFEAIEKNKFKTPICLYIRMWMPSPHTEPVEIKANFLKQLIASVCWTQAVKNMIADGAEVFVECGSGEVLISMIKNSLE